MKIIEYGNPDGKAVLCIPGVFMAGECFRTVAQELPEYRFVCVTLDGFHQGCGEFEGLVEQTDKLVQMLRERNRTKFEMAIGLSMGTIFAVRLAKNPQLQINKLFLDGAVSFYRSKVAWLVHLAIYTIFKRKSKVSRNRQKALAEIRKVYTGDWPEIILECRKSLTESSLRAISALLTEYRLESGIRQPMYLIYGGREDNIRINSQVVKALYPDAKIVVKDGYRHLEYMNHEPKEYGKILRNILNK